VGVQLLPKFLLNFPPKFNLIWTILNFWREENLGGAKVELLGVFCLKLWLVLVFSSNQSFFYDF
jgi:hypothetical protein